MASFIRVFPSGTSSLSGYRINLSNVSKIPIELGVDYFDLSLPNSTKRLLVAASGKKLDINLSAELHDDGDNKCWEIDNLGNLSGLDYITTKDQVNFLRDSLITNNITGGYQLYLDWLDASFSGNCKLSIVADGENYFSTVSLTVQFKEGGNVFGI